MARTLAEVSTAAAEGKPVTRKEAEALVKAVARTCRGPRSEEGSKVVASLMQDGLHQEAQQADAAHRKPCGADINPLILALPLDGTEHTVACPKCKQAISLRTPVFVIEG